MGNGSDSIFGPLNATVEKQNCGVKLGVGEGSVIMSAGGAFFGASALEGLTQKKSASMNESDCRIGASRFGCMKPRNCKCLGEYFLKNRGVVAEDP